MKFQRKKSKDSRLGKVGLIVSWNDANGGSKKMQAKEKQAKQLLLKAERIRFDYRLGRHRSKLVNILKKGNLKTSS